MIEEKARVFIWNMILDGHLLFGYLDPKALALWTETRRPCFIGTGTLGLLPKFKGQGSMYLLRTNSKGYQQRSGVLEDILYAPRYGTIHSTKYI